MSVDQRLRACPYCGCREFLCVQQAGIDIGQVTQTMGMTARKNLPNLYLQVTLLTCRGCGRLEMFNTNGDELMQKLGGSVIQAGA